MLPSEASGVSLAKRWRMTLGRRGWLVGWLVFILRLLMRIKSPISPPEGHIRRAKLWNYSAATTLESISCLRGYCYHFRTTAPLPVRETEQFVYIRVDPWCVFRGS